MSWNDTVEDFEAIAALDILDGKVVRLAQGDFSARKTYGDPLAVVDLLEIPAGARVHVVDLAGSRDGGATSLDVVRSLAARGLRVQAGGGIRNTEDVLRWLDAGASKVVIGTLAAGDETALENVVRVAGAERVVAAVDLRGESVRMEGWLRESDRDAASIFKTLERLQVREVLVTSIQRDGMMNGPDVALYQRLASQTSCSILASGGVASARDLLALSRIQGVSGAIVGRAFLEGALSYATASRAAGSRAVLAPRVIPCLDVDGGRVVKGVRFASMRDAGDPVACAKRYEDEGADEIVLLDIAATPAGKAHALETVRAVAEGIFIPLTAGGGVRSTDDFRALLQAGADRVAINSAAVLRPALITECASEFGSQAVVVACDAAHRSGAYEVMVSGGAIPTGIDPVGWCAEAERLGAGEILLTSVDRDGTCDGFELEMLRRVGASVSIGIIASGGAGRASDFVDAMEVGAVRALLAAGIFHEGLLTIREVKCALAAAGFAVRKEVVT